MMEAEQAVVAWPPIVTRPAVVADLPLVKDAWVKSLGRGATKRGAMGEPWVLLPNGHQVAPNVFHANLRAGVDAILGRASLIVGHREDAPDVVWCWLAFDATHDAFVLHYAWTRPELRRRGYAVELLRMAADLVGLPKLRCSHLTPAGEGLVAALRRGTVGA